MNKIPNLLQNLPKEELNVKIEEIFDNLIVELKNYLKLSVLYPNVYILFHENKKKPENSQNHILDLSVLRNVSHNILTIEIFDDFKEFLPIILLREAYYCFVPNIVKNYNSIKLLINQFVESNLKELPIIEQWQSFIRPFIINYEEDSLRFIRIEKFINLKEREEGENPIVFSLDFIRRNVSSIKDNKDELYDLLFKEFVFKTSKSFRNDELIETIRILIQIFYRVKKYNDLLDYRKYFQKFQEEGIIQTDLSLRKFTENMRWIHQYSYIAPSYQVNWKEMDMCTIACTLRFNPMIDKKRITKFIQNLPFFIWSRSSEISFAIEVFGWFNLPSCYIPDLKNFLIKLQSLNYLIEIKSILFESTYNFLNLNFFRSFHKDGTLIDRNYRTYDKKFEILFELKHSETFNKKDLTVLDFLILDRIRFFSISGFRFVRRSDTLKTLKSDLISEILKLRSIIVELKKNFRRITSNKKIKEFLLELINVYRKSGFYYLEDILNKTNEVLFKLEVQINLNQKIRNLNELKDSLKTGKLFHKIEDFLPLKNDEVKKIIFKELLPLYFIDKEKYKEKVKSYQIVNEIINLCKKSHIINLEEIEKIVEDNKLIVKLFRKKDVKFEKTFEDLNIRKISIKTVHGILDKYITSENPLIKPILINTITTTNIANYYIQMIIQYRDDVIDQIHQIKFLFPRVVFSIGRNVLSNQKLINLEFYLPNLRSEEKEILISVLKKIFGERLIKLKRYSNESIDKSFSRKEFYDFEKKEFFYTKDLFNEFLKFTTVLFNIKVNKFSENKNKISNRFWLQNVGFDSLAQKIEDRVSKQKKGFELNDLKALANFHKNLNVNLTINKQFNEFTKTFFFQNNISKIKLLPKFQAFGLGQYYLYIRPMDLDVIDYKLLLLNTFQKVQYIGAIDKSSSFFIKYIFPYRNPNQSYLNWLIYSKKIISEFYLFFIKKVYQMFHFDYNLTSKGWDLDLNYFKGYIQKILFNPSFQFQEVPYKDFNLGELKTNDFKYGNPEIEENINLTEIFDKNSIDIKELILEKNNEKLKKIELLLKKNLIFPYLKIKNLGIKETLYIIIPDLNNVEISLIIRIFSFFNFGFIYEVEGSFFLYGFEKMKENQEGVMIKLYLPDCDLSELKRILSLLFEYLKIDDYIIISDLIKGDNFVKSIYGNLINNKYNPLKNLIWSENDKKWLNHKLFTEKFEPLYPKLF